MMASFAGFLRNLQNWGISRQISSSTSISPPHFEQINGSVYQLYAPAVGEAQTAEIIFFHTIDDFPDRENAFWKTWTTSENECWPQTWLVKEENLPRARILLVSYDTTDMDPDLLGDMLVRDVIQSTEADVGRKGRCPVFLVAHSLGGLAIKQMILRAELLVGEFVDGESKLKLFLDSVRGIFYFSTPHMGPDLGADIRNFVRHLPKKNGFIHYLSNSGFAALSVRFSQWRNLRGIKAFAFCEDEVTRVGRYTGLVVQEACARCDVDFFCFHKGDHFTVCAPQRPEKSFAVRYLIDFIKKTTFNQDCTEDIEAIPLISDSSSTGNVSSSGPVAGHQVQLRENPKVLTFEVPDINIAEQLEFLNNVGKNPEIELLEVASTPEEHPSPLAPKFPWTKYDFLGAGTFGSVYEAVDRDGMWFAVKEVSMVEQDKQAQQNIAHLMQVHGKLHIFLELASKGSLATMYKRVQLSDTHISAYTRQILKGLKYLHDQNIVHRDIKCANILVDSKGICKLADFGLAKQMSSLGQIKSSKGTAYWMAPEVIDPKQFYGCPADIWSLGCSIIEMATRAPPFGDMEWVHVLWIVGHGNAPPIPDSLSDIAKDFVKHCLEVNPMMRLTATQLLDHQFVCKLEA